MRCPVCIEPYSRSINPDHELMHVPGTKEWQRQQVWYMRVERLNWGEIAIELNMSANKVKNLFMDIYRRELK